MRMAFYRILIILMFLKGMAMNEYVSIVHMMKMQVRVNNNRGEQQHHTDNRCDNFFISFVFHFKNIFPDSRNN